MSHLGKIISSATAVVCSAVLVISIYPGWLSDLLFRAVLVGFMGIPVILVLFAVVPLILLRRISWGRTIEVPWKPITFILLMLLVTYAALRLYIPRRIAFATVRSTFQRLVDDGMVNDPQFNQSIGPYHVDSCMIDERGGVYFRVYSSADGLGPDVVSYGFCHNPNQDGSPFGAAHYGAFRLGNGWYWFRASDDWY